MKEATGELNLTVVVVVLVAALVALFSIFIWPTVQNGLHDDEKCSDAVCGSDDDKDGYVQCTRNGSEPFQCPYKG